MASAWIPQLRGPGTWLWEAPLLTPAWSSNRLAAREGDGFTPQTCLVTAVAFDSRILVSLMADRKGRGEGAGPVHIDRGGAGGSSGSKPAQCSAGGIQDWGSSPARYRDSSAQR